MDMGSSARGSGTAAAAAASGVADMDIDGDRAIHTASAAADSSTPASSVDVALRRDVLVQFLEAEIGRHLVLVQASAGPHSQIAVQFPTKWRDLRILLKKVALDIDSEDPWRTLGYAFLDGAMPH